MTAKQIIEKAKAELGVMESPAGSNNVKYNTWYYGREVHDHDINPTITYPWCVVFLAWLFKAEQGLCKKTASSSDLYRWFLARNQIVKTPQPGDIVFFKWNAKKDCIAEHVGIVISVSGNVINTIEGNTSQTSNDNGGKVMQRNRYSNIVGYARPKYSNIVTSNPSIGKTQEDYEHVVKRVLRGEYGVQPKRQKKLEAEGYDYNIVKQMVNKVYGK